MTAVQDILTFMEVLLPELAEAGTMSDLLCGVVRGGHRRALLRSM